MARFFSGIIMLFVLACSLNVMAKPASCTYSTYKWNTIERQAVKFEKISKPYSSLTINEIDPMTGCSVCEEDQVIIKISDLPPVKVCRALASIIHHVLKTSVDSGQKIQEITGYRVGLTRGDVDIEGNRTVYSNHSFGTAVDINASHNGLYDHCLIFSSTCRLIKGGVWEPEHAESITGNSVLGRFMKKSGFLWGGEIQGKQKDFMHFSLTGY